MFRLWLKNFINLIYPLTCLICGVKLSPLSEKPLCPICWSKVEYNPAPFCRVCGRHLPASVEPAQVLICRDCQNRQFYFKRVRSVCRYQGIIKECIHLLKYNAKLSLAKPLSELMINFARNHLDMPEIDLILPVPLHSKKLRQRQFNQAQILGQSLACAFSREIHPELITRVKSAPAQVNLSRAKRLRNLRGAFATRRGLRLKDKTVLLIDDVFTTGATVNECAKLLQEAGAKRIEVFTLARGA